MHSALRYAIVACLVAILGCFSESAAAAQRMIELQGFGPSATLSPGITTPFVAATLE